MAMIEEQHKYTALREWFLSPQGQAVAQAFVTELVPIKSALHGKYLLQLGDCGENQWLDALYYQRKWLLVSPELAEGKNRVSASVSVLPFEREVMDCIIAPLTLEACAQNKSPIDEIDRILKPMGYIVFFGINPWSFWGASLHWGRLSCFARASATLSSSITLKNAMLSRGYRQCWLSSFYYIPPIERKNWIDRLAFLNQMGKMVWPYPAGFYCLIMQKHDDCMTAISEPLRDEFYLAQT